MGFSTRITIDGLSVVINVPRGSRAWQKSNAVFCPLGPAPTQAWFLMLKGDLDSLDVNGTHSVTWQTVSDDGSFDSSLTFPGLYIVNAERLLHGGPGDPNALYLVEFADGRYIAENASDSGVIQANIRSFANAADYLTGTTTYGTWDNLLGGLWSACGTLGSYPGLPGTLPIDGVPQNTWLIGLNAYRALNAVLDQLDCAIQHDPLANAYSIVQLGATQSIVAGATTLKWNGEPKSINATQAAANLTVYHYSHYKAYGQERDTEIGSNWAAATSGPTPIATGITGAQGTTALWDDLPIVLDETNQNSNAAAIATRDNNRKSRYVSRYTVNNQHRIHFGLINSFLPGGQIRACLWRNWDDGDENAFGGTVTEFLCCSQLITGMRGGSDGSPAWLDSAIAAPEREAYSPPDLSRHSFPNYPRLPNVVQVWHEGATLGDAVAPDATVGGIKLHSGRVKRWTANSMATLDPCWILFVDDFDNNSGNLASTQGEYYGPARLSGVSSVSASMLPVYVVRRGLQSTDASQTVVFQLTSTLALTGIASAQICYIDPVLGEYSASNLPADAIAVVDLYRTIGEWQGAVGYKGIGRRRADSKYDVIWMERPALFTEATLAQDMQGSSTTADSQSLFHYQQGNKTPPNITLNDPNGFYPKALTGGKGLWAWNDRRSELEAVICQQQGIYATARLTNAITDETDVPFDHFEIQSFSPFNLVPAEITAAQNSGTAINLLGCHGEAGDTIILLWLHQRSKWLVLHVQEFQRWVEMVTIEDHANGQNIGATNLKEGGVSRSRALFYGRVIQSYFGGLLPAEGVTTSRQCIIHFSDFDLAPGDDSTVIAEQYRVYGPAKWIGVASAANGFTSTADFGKPIYRCSVGEQEFHGKFPFDVPKGDTQAITLYTFGNPPQPGPTMMVTTLYNEAEANKFCRVHRDNGGSVANQVEF